MRKCLAIALLGALVVVGVLVAIKPGRAEETSIKSRIVSVDLFKNGLAVVRCEVKLPGAGKFVAEGLPEPVHGTWWVQSETPVETQVTEREIDKPFAGQPLNFQKILAGKNVTIHFREGQIPPATGKVEAISDNDERNWNRAYQRPEYGYYYSNYLNSSNTPAPRNSFLVLQTETGRVFVDTAQIAYVKSDGKEALRSTVRVPVMLLNTANEKPATVLITCLTKGLAWAPSYRVDISDPKTLVIEQNAAIKNELAGLENAEIQLISGFASIQFSHVVSPLSTRTTWTNFFQQLNQRVVQSNYAIGQAVRQQLVSTNAADSGGVDLSATPTGEGVDLHYQAIGARTLKEGDALALSIATEKAPYERIVEWLVPDTRNEYGQPIQDYQRQQDPEKYQDAAWDAVCFKNPFKFPMTTAPALTMANGRFNGQQMSLWVNSGEETRLRVTKALSVRTRSVEKEEQVPGGEQRDIVYIGGRQFRKTSVKGELTVNNHRKEEVKLVIRRHFSGELSKAEGDPKKSLREEGVYSINPRNELTWTVTLKPGEEKTLTYQYSVLVPH